MSWKRFVLNFQASPSTPTSFPTTINITCMIWTKTGSRQIHLEQMRNFYHGKSECLPDLKIQAFP